MAELFLYRKIEWTWKWNGPGSQPPPIVKFLNSILHRPGLAQHIQTLSILGDNTYFYKKLRPGNLLLKVPVDMFDLDAAVTTIKAFHVHYFETWEEELRRGTFDSLKLLPNLRLLSLGQN